MHALHTIADEALPGARKELDGRAVVPAEPLGISSKALIVSLQSLLRERTQEIESAKEKRREVERLRAAFRAID